MLEQREGEGEREREGDREKVREREREVKIQRRAEWRAVRQDCMARALELPNIVSGGHWSYLSF